MVHKNYHTISNDVARPIEGRANKAWWAAFALALLASLWGAWAIWVTLRDGIGAWGLNKTVGWAWDITNFVWWIGIGHAGTLISAVLLLFRQQWRVAINRSAEAMTIFAVIQAGIFPILHMGRPWLLHFTLPIPNQYGSLWDNFNSPLLWDVFAIATYFSVSLVFWWVGLLPDFAMLRDRTLKPFQKKIYSLLSFGWSGKAKDWQRMEETMLLLAGIATPLVVSVHTIVSFDFATSVIPGWHTTIFPPYFVAGAIFSGFAMVSLLLIILRKVCKLEDYITLKHINLMNTVMLVAGSIVAVAYLTEFVMAFHSDSEFEQYVFVNRATGPYAWAFWTMMACNVLLPQLLWFKKLRRNIAFSVFVALVVCVGMWFERFVIIVTSLHRDYLPSSWSMFSPTWVDIGIFVGTLGFFFVLFLLYARSFPMIAQAEVKAQVVPNHTPQEAKVLVEASAMSETIVLDSAESFLQKIKELRSQNRTVQEVYTPFAVHGLDEALGMKRTRLGKATFVYGLIGFIFGCWLTYFTMIKDWPQHFGGKPNATFWENLPSFVPVIFELVVYFAAHLLVLSFFFRSKLYPFKKADNPVKKSSDDKFVIILPNLNGEVREEKKTANYSKLLLLLLLPLLLISCRNKQERNVEFAPDMYESPAYRTYEVAPLLPPEHTVKRGSLPYTYPNTQEGYEQAKIALHNPLATDSLQQAQHIAQGKELYSVYCALCHGDKGDGKGVLVQREKILGVPNYASRELTEGSIYHVLYYGRNTMGSFANQLSEKERWQVVMFVQQLKGNK
jgi:polysulphide reductase nrfD